MSDLRYRWGDDTPQESPAPPSASTVAILVAGREAWRGDVTDALRAWARWCALQVVDRWDCPEVVQRYLETGDEGLREEARTTARAAYLGTARALARDAHDATVSRAAKAAWGATQGHTWDAIWDAGTPPAWNACNSAADEAAWASAGDAAASSDANARAAQTTHLRRLILRRALPEDLWPLIDRVAIGGDERVLCDALLEGQGG